MENSCGTRGLGDHSIAELVDSYLVFLIDKVFIIYRLMRQGVICQLLQQNVQLGGIVAGFLMYFLVQAGEVG